jgi:hypothetical protein
MSRGRFARLGQPKSLSEFLPDIRVQAPPVRDGVEINVSHCT